VGALSAPHTGCTLLLLSAACCTAALLLLSRALTAPAAHLSGGKPVLQDSGPLEPCTQTSETTTPLDPNAHD
jgi:hypothetical protein